ncbi:NHL domain-containing thioredoxin family protein [Fodinicola feengrottensis]|uniref:NHL domain-containing thioredoxin family protein n=1 Tax=Fodinicola feengrottensis TaxID=435914 RepID=UPI0031E21BD9
MATERVARVRAPELVGAGGWINTGGRELTLADLRGKIVLLDFWTFCCVNCLHVIDELRPLEAKYGDVLVTIGVHSPKFEHERDHLAVLAAVERYGVHHPVLDDPRMVTWQQYAVRAWPTLALVDPEGYVVAQAAGEGHVAGLDRVIGEVVAEHEARGTLHRGDGPYVPPPAPPTVLRFPGKIAVTADKTFLVSDSQQHSLVELAADGETVLRRIGSGERGFTDGSAETARFAEPQGVLVLPTGELLVADTVNHALRTVDLVDGRVRTVAKAPDGVPLSPWDLAWYDNAVIVAAAGIHQLWRFDPTDGSFLPWAGTTVEGLKDGPLADTWMAQPSGLAADGDRLWIADSETSALRYAENGELHTAVGEGLFDFGHVDGPAAKARFQHPLGVAVLADHSVAVLDTYNNAVRRYDPTTREVSTLATGVAEPSDAVEMDGQLVVVESATHRLSRPVSPGKMRKINGPAMRTERPVTDLAPGAITLDVVFSPPPGQKLDERYGPSTRLQVSSTPPELLIEGAGDTTDLNREIVLADNIKDGVLHVTAQAAACDEGVEHPACHLIRQDWGVPIRVTHGSATHLPLILRG